jgi:tetratricopeptide (TPR) repeat protein
MTIAFQGDLGQADSLFERLLLRNPEDARVLTNLGNVKLLADERRSAVALYERAVKVDSTDGGIVLNQATAYLLDGNWERAQERAALAITLAGGTSAAARLIGLRLAEGHESSPKAADRAQLTGEELLENLLDAARGSVPGDTLLVRSTADSTKAVQKPKQKGPRWRIAAARGEIPEVAHILYWKK